MFMEYLHPILYLDGVMLYEGRRIFGSLVVLHYLNILSYDIHYLGNMDELFRLIYINIFKYVCSLSLPCRILKEVMHSRLHHNHRHPLFLYELNGILGYISLLPVKHSRLIECYLCKFTQWLRDFSLSRVQIFVQLDERLHLAGTIRQH